jgi:hypothetical protein
VLKLDFAKTFDTVIWESLITIMQARGFDQLWCSWILNILSSSKSAVLVNGCPGNWINCKRGLRQGDPLSPYLFLLVADTLQTMLRSAPEIKHPIDHAAPCVILQYADDTLIVLKGDCQAVQALKNVLDAFSDATGLRINYTKEHDGASSFGPGCRRSVCINSGLLPRVLPANLLGASTV